MYWIFPHTSNSLRFAVLLQKQSAFIAIKQHTYLKSHNIDYYRLFCGIITCPKINLLSLDDSTRKLLICLFLTNAEKDIPYFKSIQLQNKFYKNV